MAQFAPPSDNFDDAQRDAWFPRVGTGYFYTNDRQYYLYAKKRTRTLRDATCLIFELADMPIPGSVQVQVEGVAYSNFAVEGNELIVKLDDVDSFVSLWTQLQLDLSQWGFVEHGFGFGPSNQVEVSYDFLEWVDVTTAPEPTGNRYARQSLTETFQIKDADRIEYRLTKQGTVAVPTGVGDTDPLIVPTGIEPDLPVDCAPVVITDDSLEYFNPLDYQVEFAVDPLTGELLFNSPRNFLQNPSFEVVATGVQHDDPTFAQPSEWRVTDSATTPDVTGKGYHGYRCRGIHGTGVVDQTVRINPLENYVAAVHVIDGTAELCVNFLDADRVYLDATGIPVTGQPRDTRCLYGAQTGGATWVRATLAFGKKTGACDEPAEVFPIPTAAEYLEFRLRRIAGLPCVDAAGLYPGLVAPQFFAFDPRMTIEHETSEAGFYTPELSTLLTTELNDIDVNPLSTPAPGGFLFIEEFSSVDDYHLGKGQVQTEQVLSPTGVLEVTGAVDVVVGRQFLPYAKTSGWTKLRQRQTFHLQNPPPVHDVTDLQIENGNPRPVPAAIEWVAAEGLQADGDDPVLVVVPDSRIPVRIDAFVYDKWENPAFYYTGLASALTGVVTPEDAQTSAAGQLALFYTPPDVTAGSGDLGPIDTIRLRVGEVVRELAVRGYRGTALDYDAFLGLT